MPTAAIFNQLRAHMLTLGLDALVVPSGDDFLNEYVPHHLNRRQWLSGFTGSAGDLLLNATQAVLFVDGRYHEQVDSQIDGALIRAEKVGQKGSKSISEVLAEWVNESPTPTYTIGVPATCVAQAHLQRWQKATADALKLSTPKPEWRCLTQHPVDSVWANRPQWHPAAWEILSPEVAGEATQARINRIREKMAQQGATALPITATDHLAWLLNIRSTDIPHTPVALAYGYLSENELHVFMAPEAQTTDITDYISSLGGQCHPIKDFYEFLHQQWQAEPKTKPLLDKNSTPAAVFAAAQQLHPVYQASPIETAKAVKNPSELNGMRQAHLAASVALCTAWYKLETRLEHHTPTTEADYSTLISEAYAAHPASRGLSFPSIVGTGENGAIVHYGTPSPTRTIEPGELVLFDSGGQYCANTSNPQSAWMGTTDTTRTILAGSAATHGIRATEQQQHRYTMVLKSHIATAQQRFPKGTSGIQIDAITRSALWQEGLDFLHGTGHGVGCFLGVHEGPIGISKGYTTPFEPGHITSIEPGFYQGGWGGIRLENLVEVITTEHTLSTTGEPLLGFAPLMFVPFDLALINSELLSHSERIWLNQYHAQVLQRIAPQLNNTDHQQWLAAKCAPIHGH